MIKCIIFILYSIFYQKINNPCIICIQWSQSRNRNQQPIRNLADQLQGNHFSEYIRHLTAATFIFHMMHNRRIYKNESSSFAMECSNLINGNITKFFKNEIDRRREFYLMYYISDKKRKSTDAGECQAKRLLLCRKWNAPRGRLFFHQKINKCKSLAMR